MRLVLVLASLFAASALVEASHNTPRPVQETSSGSGIFGIEAHQPTRSSNWRSRTVDEASSKKAMECTNGRCRSGSSDLEYELQVTTAGSYYVWLRLKSSGTVRVKLVGTDLTPTPLASSSSSFVWVRVPGAPTALTPKSSGDSAKRSLQVIYLSGSVTIDAAVLTRDANLDLAAIPAPLDSTRDYRMLANMQAYLKPVARRQAGPSGMCYAAMWNDGEVVEKVIPLSKKVANGFLDASAYYSYSTPYGFSMNSPDDLEESQVAQYFFYDDQETVSLFISFDRPNDPDGGIVRADVTSENLAGRGGGILVKDDPNDSSYVWDYATGTASPSWRWWPCCTDGFVMGPLPNPPMASTNVDAASERYCINFAFKGTPEGVDTYKVRTYEYWPNATHPSPPIKSLNVPAASANSLKMCYTQCECPTTSVLDAVHLKVDPTGVTTGSGGAIGEYMAGAACRWDLVKPSDAVSMSAYWNDVHLTTAGDQVNVATGNSTGDYVNPSVQNYAGPNVDHLTAISATQASANVPPTWNQIAQSTEDRFIVEFSSGSGSARGRGFELEVFVEPLLYTVSPSSTANPSGVAVELAVKYAASSPFLTVRFGAVTINSADITFISDTRIAVNAPSATAALGGNTAVGTVQVSVANDGIVFAPAVTFEYANLCLQFNSSCSACIARPECAYCNAVPGAVGGSPQSHCVPAEPQTGFPADGSCLAADDYSYDCCTNCNPPPLCAAGDVSRLALSDLYTAAGGSAWTRKSNWNTGDPCENNWEGVDCEGMCIVALRLGSNNLVGSLPASISNVKQLRYLNVEKNQLTGPLPSTINFLSQLEILKIGSNRFTGELPEVDGLTRLELFDGSTNVFEGPIPASFGQFGSQLAWLNLADNILSGCIPSTMRDFDMNKLKLADNYFACALPGWASAITAPCACDPNNGGCTVYTQYFQPDETTGGVPKEWSREDSPGTPLSTYAPGGGVNYALGEFSGGQSVRVQWDVLPPHAYVTLFFDVIVNATNGDTVDLNIIGEGLPNDRNLDHQILRAQFGANGSPNVIFRDGAAQVINTPVAIDGTTSRYPVELYFLQWRTSLAFTFEPFTATNAVWGLDNFRMSFGVINTTQAGVFLAQGVLAESSQVGEGTVKGILEDVICCCDPNGCRIDEEFAELGIENYTPATSRVCQEICSYETRCNYGVYRVKTNECERDCELEEDGTMTCDGGYLCMRSNVHTNLPHGSSVTFLVRASDDDATQSKLTLTSNTAEELASADASADASGSHSDDIDFTMETVGVDDLSTQAGLKITNSPSAGTFKWVVERSGSGMGICKEMPDGKCEEISSTFDAATSTRSAELSGDGTYKSMAVSDMPAGSGNTGSSPSADDESSSAGNAGLAIAFGVTGGAIALAVMVSVVVGAVIFRNKRNVKSKVIGLDDLSDEEVVGGSPGKRMPDGGKWFARSVEDPVKSPSVSSIAGTRAARIESSRT